MLRSAADQRGSIPVILMWITMGFLILIAISYDFLAVFVARRVSQKAADAAALASADKWYEQAKADGEAEAKVRFAKFKHDMAETVAKELAKWDEAHDDPDADPAEIEKNRAAYEKQRREEYIKLHIHTAAVRNDLLANHTPYIEALVVEFISPKDAGCIAFAAGSKAEGSMHIVSNYFATQNGANGLEPGVQYPIVFDGSPRIEVSTATRIHLGIFDHALDEAHRQVRATAFSSIDELGPVVIEWTSGCGGS
jgi:hypothetical protein